MRRDTLGKIELHGIFLCLDIGAVNVGAGMPVSPITDRSLAGLRRQPFTSE